MESSHGKYCNCCFELEEHTNHTTKHTTFAYKTHNVLLNLMLFEISTLARKIDLLSASVRLMHVLSPTQLQYFVLIKCM